MAWYLVTKKHKENFTFTFTQKMSTCLCVFSPVTFETIFEPISVKLNVKVLCLWSAVYPHYV